MLLAERTGAEWEILEGNEWEEEEAEAGAEKDAKGPNLAKIGIEETGILVKPTLGTHGEETGGGWCEREDGEERKGSNGWMKLKNR